MAAPLHVVIVGGGFAGINAAASLRRENVRITLIDRRNHHLFQPLLYQVATAALAPSDIAEPIRSILRKQRNATVRLAEVVEIDVIGKRLRLVDPRGPEEGSWLEWDRLVVAAGARHAYFGHDEWEADAPGLKTIADALDIRRRVLCAFERAEWADPEELESLLTFVVVGAGPTGVELAGALTEIALHTVANDFRNIDTTQARVILVEGGPHVLPAMPEKLRISAREQLEKLGVEIRANTLVTGVDDGGVWLGDERLDAATVLWAAGVQASPLAAMLGVPTDRVGRVTVEPDLSVPGHPDVFAIGDLAAFTQDGELLPGVAPVALTQGRHVGRCISADLRGEERPAYRYFDKGNLATIGRSKAVGAIGRLRISGFVAWFLWAFVHLLFLVTYRNRLLVFTKWAWAWMTFERASRLLWQHEAATERQEEQARSVGRR